MTITVGIPRALLYYEFEKLWTTFYKKLGAQVITSGPTNKYMLDRGSGLVVDEVCLPVKVFFGHSAQLAAQQVDYLFVPRVVSVEHKAYICPKVMGLPDMLEASRAKLPQVIKPTFNRVSSDRIDNFLFEAGSCITSNKELIREAWRCACRAQEEHELSLNREFAYPGSTDSLSILIIGHPYLIFDNFLNMNLLKKLQGMGCNVILPLNIPRKWKDLSLKHLPKQIFWSYGRDLLGASLCFSQLPGRKGAILLTSFGCGIDSFIGNMILRHLNRRDIPHLNLTLDEHTGEAGVDTRIEAFTDMMRWRRVTHENHFPAYGEYMGTYEGTSGICGTPSCSTTTLQ